MHDISDQCDFQADRNKCVHCGLCQKVCNGAVIQYDPDGFPVLKPFEHFGGDAAGSASIVWVYVRQEQSRFLAFIRKTVWKSPVKMKEWKW